MPSPTSVVQFNYVLHFILMQLAKHSLDERNLMPDLRTATGSNQSPSANSLQPSVSSAAGSYELPEDDSKSNESQTAPSQRTEADYAEALSTILDIADIALSFVPAAGAAKGVVKLAAKAAPTAKVAVVGAKKVVANNPELAGKAAQAVSAASSAAAQSAPDVMAKAGGMFSKVKNSIGSAASAATSTVKEKAQEASAAREEMKSREEARRVLLEGAGLRLEADKFLENWKVSSLGADANQYLAFPGCYVALTFGKLSRKSDFARFRDVYVGGAEYVGEAIWKDLVGLGNPDVYADVKYDQDVQLLVFPCDANKVEALRDSIIVALDADESYNRQYGAE